MNEKEASEKIDQIWDIINDYADSSGTIKAVDVFQAICKVVTHPLNQTERRGGS